MPNNQKQQLPMRVAKARLLRDQAYEIIKDAITNLTYKPGQELREAVLSEDLGISKTPIREALFQLQNDGFIEILPFKGAVVTDIVVEDAVKIYEFRELLEVPAARLAAKTCTTEEIEYMWKQIIYMKAAIEANDRRQYEKSHQDLHFSIIEKTNNKWIVKALRNLEDYVVRIRISALGNEKVTDAFLEDYESLVTAIENRDADQAGKIMKGHFKKVVNMFIKHKNTRFL